MRKKMLISIVVISIMLLNCIAPLLQVAAGTDVKILFEKNLFAALKEDLQKRGITAVYNDAQRTIIINDDEIAKVTTLSLSNSELTDLTGLEIFTNLSWLDLSGNELTKDSNLEVLNSFSNLKYLDLSSNEIEDLSMVTNIKNIETLNLHNQKFDVVEIIQVDSSESSNQYTSVLYPLPKILTDFVDYIPSEWLIEKNYLKDPLDYETDVSGQIAPYIYWSGFDHENLKVVYATKTDVSYFVHKGMVKISIRVSDSSSTLYNSEINLYFVTADSSERGIHIKDTNMYNAIKKQLTRGQRDNEELISYAGNTNARHIYNRYFDEAQTLVIDIDDLVNKIPSLKLDNKRIKDITGIEKFIGLETEIDLSGNYIKSIDKIVELEKNQEIEEALLRQRVSAQIALVAETIGKIDKVKGEIDAINNSMKTLDEAYAKLQEQLTKLQTEREQINNKIKETTEKIAALNKEVEDLKNVSIVELENSIKTANEEIEKIREEINKKNQEIANKNKEIAELEAGNKGEADTINAKKAELEADKAKLTSLQTDIANKQAEIDAKNESLAQVNEAISTHEVAIAVYEAELAELNVDLAKVQKEIVDRLGAGADVSSDSVVKEINKQITEKTAQVTELSTKISENTEEKRALENAITNLNKELDTLKANKVTLESVTIPNLEKEIKDLEEAFASNANNQKIAELKAQIDQIKTVDIPKLETDITAKQEKIADAQKQIDDIKKQITDKQTEVEKANAELEKLNNDLAAKIEEIKKVVEEMNNNDKQKAELNLKLTELTTELNRLMGILMVRMNRLYTIYNRIDRLVGIITPELRNITDLEFYDLTFEGSKALFSSQVSKIGTIEKYLTAFESNYLIKLYNIPTTISTEVKKTVVNPDGTTSTVTETETKPIENPISKWFSELATDEWTLVDYKMWLNNLRRDDIYFAMYAYCYMTRLFEGTTTCEANGYPDYIIKRLEIDGEDTSRYEYAKENYQSIYATYAGTDKCAGTVDTRWLYNYAKRITLATGDVNTYVYLPRLRILNVRENLIENIDTISQLTKLVELYAGDNEIVDISKVDWASVNTHLRKLDLSLNDISYIEPLEVMSNLEYLDLSKNLIEGEFNFKIEKLEKLRYVDFSYNRIEDIQRLINYLAYEARHHGYNGDIASFLRNAGYTINFKHQQLEMTIDNVLPVGDTEKVELHKIFRQIEEIDYANTSFGIDSLRGNVTSDGKYVILDTRTAGKHVATVTIINTKTTSSFGFGTTCVITYRVGTANMLEVHVTPEEVEVEKGATQQFDAEVTGENVPYSGVVWSVEGNESEGTTVSEEGLLQVAENETAEKIEVVATSFYDEASVGKATVTVIEKKEVADPETPTEPQNPETPTEPQKPETPTEPQKPETPAEPQKPETPAEPQKPETPVESPKPETPTEPQKPETPAEPTKPETPVKPDNSGNEENNSNTNSGTENKVADIKLGYTVDSDTEYLTGVKAQTTVEDFKSILLNNNDEYKAVVKSSKREVTTGYVGTGMFVQIQDKEGNVVKDANGNLLVYEIVVKGDVNGDGSADSLDTVLIKSHRAEVKTLNGAALKAADLNDDNSIDFTDSKLLLYHRAEVRGYNLNYTK